MSVQQEKVTLTADRFSDLHNEYSHRLLNSMTAMVRDREAAQEITAEAFARAFEKRARFRGASKPNTWLYKIALNEARLQQSQRRPISLDALQVPPPELIIEDRLDEALESSWHRLRLQKALAALPVIQRRVLVDHFVRGYSVRQIARRGRIPIGTVLSRIFTAKRLLRAAWEA